MSELITINFLPGEEGITWKRRKPHSIHIKKEVIKKSTTKREPEIISNKDSENGIMVYQKVPEIKKPKPNELLYIKDISEKVRLLYRKAIVNNKNLDVKNSITNEIKALETDLKNHRDYFCNLELSTQYIKMINDLIHVQYTFGYRVTAAEKNSNNSEKGIKVTQQLAKLKKQIKKKNLLIKDKEELLKQLDEIKLFIENNKDDFTMCDNIPGKLNQIEQYKNKLTGNPNILKKKTENTINEVEQPKKKFKVVLRKHSLDS